MQLSQRTCPAAMQGRPVADVRCAETVGRGLGAPRCQTVRRRQQEMPRKPARSSPRRYRGRRARPGRPALPPAAPTPPPAPPLRSRSHKPSTLGQTWLPDVNVRRQAHSGDCGHETTTCTGRQAGKAVLFSALWQLRVAASGFRGLIPVATSRSCIEGCIISKCRCHRHVRRLGSSIRLRAALATGEGVSSRIGQGQVDRGREVH